MTHFVKDVSVRRVARVRRVVCRATVVGVLVSVLVGCAPSRPILGSWEGPGVIAPVNIEALAGESTRVQVLRTPNYRIYTTITDQETLDRMAQTLEGALTQYRRLVPDLPTRADPRPLEAYVFASRAEWAEFTARRTGPDARIYLQINRGGYTIGDWFAGFWIGDGTYAMVAHEGWHQFVGRNFVGRLPPFMDEGFACMFENIRWQPSRGGEVPQWNLSQNRGRALALRNAIDDRKTFPLQDLVSMHAGDVIHMPPDRVDAFYAQNWAFARFLWEGENQKHRPAMQRMLRDLASGKNPDGTQRPGAAALGWQPKTVRPMLETYLGTNLDAIDVAYQAYVRQIAYDELSAQWDL